MFPVRQVAQDIQTVTLFSSSLKMRCFAFHTHSIGWGCSSVIELVLSMHEALSSILRTKNPNPNQNQTRKQKSPDQLLLRERIGSSSFCAEN